MLIHGFYVQNKWIKSHVIFTGKERYHAFHESRIISVILS